MEKDLFKRKKYRVFKVNFEIISQSFFNLIIIYKINIKINSVR